MNHGSTLAMSSVSVFFLALTGLLLVSCVKAQTKLAGYTPVTNVDEHAKIDLDQEVMEDTTDAGDWAGANTIYSQGEHSMKSDKKRTLKAFSTEAGEKMANEPYFRLYREYWGAPDYADRFVSDALKDAGDYVGKQDKFRGECANKGSQYQNVWMYVIHEMEDAINDCFEGDLNDNDKRVQAWDEAWAFWVGSSINADGTNGGDGFLGYTLAQKRAADYGTENEQKVARVNANMLKFFKEGQKQLQDRKCDDARETKNKITVQMTIPLVQGIIRYIIRGRKSADNPDEEDEELGKNHGEGWAFTAAALPLIAHCDRSVAERLIDNFHPRNEKPMKDSIQDVMRDLQSVYRCLGFTCEDIGKEDPLEPECRLSGPEFKPIPGSDKSASGKTGSGGLSGGAIAGIIIAILVVVAVSGFFVLRRRAKKAAGLPTAAGMRAEDDMLNA